MRCLQRTCILRAATDDKLLTAACCMGVPGGTSFWALCCGPAVPLLSLRQTPLLRPASERLKSEL
jgi:hypothetical protein